MMNTFNQWDKTNILIIVSGLVAKIFKLNC